MMKKLGIFLAVLAGVVALTSSADASFSDCKSIADPTKRLACYDKAANAAAPSGKTPAVNPVKGTAWDAASNTIPAKPIVKLTPQKSDPRSWYEVEGGFYGFFRNLPTQAGTAPPTSGPTPIPTAPGFIGLFSMSTVTNPIPAGSAPIAFGGGASYRMGYWLDPQHTMAVEGSAFLAAGYSKSSPVPPSLTTSTFVNTTPDVFVGLFNDTTTTMPSGAIWDVLYSGDVNFRMTVPHFPYLTNFDVLVGVRYVGLDEFTGSSVTVSTRTYQPALGLPAPSNAPIVNSSSPGWFSVYNNFIGPQIGFDAEQHWGRFWVESENEVAVGATIELVSSGPTSFSITPTTTTALAGIPLTVSSGAPPVTGVSGGTAGVIGAFTVVPSGTLKIGYDIIPDKESLTLAYNYLYMSNVGLIAPSVVGTRPSSFFAQGITLGLKEKF